MFGTASQSMAGTGLASLRRNNYFHGKLMDAFHFDLETDYHRSARHLVNRLVLGYGVVCGLNVTCPEKECEPSAIIIGDGVALDKWGREIVVPVDSAPIPITDELIADAWAIARGQAKGGYGPCEGCRSHHKDQDLQEDRDPWVHIVICHHECQENPMPVLVGDCNGSQPCTPGTIREWYKVELRPGRIRRPNLHCSVPDAVTGSQVNYPVLVRWVTFGGDPDAEANGCPTPDDPCIPLANIPIVTKGTGESAKDVADCANIDIDVRPIVYSNDLLFEMFLDAVTGRGRARTNK